MKKENVRFLLVWMAVILFASLVMAFSFYIFLLFLPLMLIITIFCFLDSINKKTFRRSRNPGEVRVIDIDSEVVSSNRK